MTVETLHRDLVATHRMIRQLRTDALERGGAELWSLVHRYTGQLLDIAEQLAIALEEAA